LRDALKTFLREKIEAHAQAHPGTPNRSTGSIIRPARFGKVTKVGFFRQMGGPSFERNNIEAILPLGRSRPDTPRG
jgi:hypothetical protein